MTEEAQDDKATRESTEHKVVEHIVKVQNDKPDSESAELAMTKDKLEQREAQLESLVLKEFEDKKSELVEQVRKSLGDEKAEEVAESITNGSQLESVRTVMNILQSGIDYGKSQSSGSSERVTPRGKLSGRSPPRGSNSVLPEFEKTEDLVNFVFDNLEEQLFLQAANQPHDDVKLTKYRNLEQKLLKSLVGGIKARRNTDTGKWVVTQCRSCGKILTGGESRCPECDRPILLEQRGV